MAAFDRPAVPGNPPPSLTPVASGAEPDDGVDVAQIQDMLRRTPEERLEALRGFAAGLVELIDAAKRP